MEILIKIKDAIVWVACKVLNLLQWMICKIFKIIPCKCSHDCNCKKENN
jgi:hypothetical protein